MMTKQVGGNFPRKKTVFVVDDHPIVRQGLTLLINQEADLAVCGAAEEMQSALAAIQAVRPDILIVDISLNGERALRAGASGYIMKQEATEKVLVALRRILSGEIYVSERIANSMLQHYVHGAHPLEHSSGA